MANPLEIPNKLEARSFKQLRVLMFANNVGKQGKHIYDIRPPSFKGDVWYAFYYERVDPTEFLKKQIEETKDK